MEGLRIGVLREGFGAEDSEPDVDAKVRKAIRTLEQLGAQASEVSVPAHLEAANSTWAIAVEGTAAQMYANGVGYHLKGLYNESLATAVGEFRRVRGNELPPTMKLALILGTYLNQRYHGRLYAKAAESKPAVAGRLRRGVFPD